MKKIVSILLTAAVGSSILSGCTDEEIATSIGGAALIGGAILIGSNSTCQGGYQTKCHTSTDYWGRSVRECRTYYDSCAYLRPKNRDYDRGHHHLQANTDSINPSSETDSIAIATTSTEIAIGDINVSAIDSVKWSEEFGISFAASDRLLNALNAAKLGSKEALLNIGLGPADILNLSKQTLPTPEGLDRLANILKSDKATVSLMMQKLLRLSVSPTGQSIIKNIQNSSSK